MEPRSRRTALVAGTVLLLTGCGGPAAPELAVLDRSATAEDAVPDGVEVPEGVDDLRHVAEADGAQVYAGRGAADHPWCVVVLVGSVEGENWVTGSSCTDDDTFAERGVWVEVGGADVERGAATLLPDDFDGELRPSWEIAGPNLALPTE
ncbi:hypothetical protein [Blastococcus sp. SYSU DS0828]